MAEIDEGKCAGNHLSASYYGDCRNNIVYFGGGNNTSVTNNNNFDFDFDFDYDHDHDHDHDSTNYGSCGGQ